MVSVTIMFGIIAMISTIGVVIMTLLLIYIEFFYDIYLYEWLSVIVSIDCTINILCLNLGFEYGSKLYKKLRCYKLEQKCKTFVVWCFNDHKKCNIKCQLCYIIWDICKNIKNYDNSRPEIPWFFHSISNKHI